MANDNKDNKGAIKDVEVEIPEVKKEKPKKKHFQRTKALWEDFKKFISRGNIIDMAVGVIIGAAFKSIINTTVNIIMSLCTWGVPGGLDNLVTYLPAITSQQRGPIIEGQAYGQFISAEQFAALKNIEPEKNYQSWYTAVEGSNNYRTSATSCINWGDWINAIINFIIIAITLFIIVKVVQYIQNKRNEFKAQALEKYYLAHPEERPVPVEPGKPAPTELEVLTDIRDMLKEQKGKGEDK